MSFWQRIWNFFANLFNWDPEEAAKRKDLSKIYKYLGSITPAFFNKNSGELLPGFAKILFSFIRYLYPIRNLLEKTLLNKDYKIAELYKNYLIEAQLPESEQTKRHNFTDKIIKERIFDSVSGKDEINKIKHEFHEYVKQFSTPGFSMVNKELNDFYKFITICQHNYEPLLSLFDQELIVSSNSYTPKFKAIQGSDCIPELMDLYYITADFLMSETIGRYLTQLIDRLGLSQADVIKKKISRLLTRADKILRTYLTPQVLLCLLRAMKEDPGFVAEMSKEASDYIDQYVSKISTGFRQMLDRILREISENNIAQDLEQLFGNEKLHPPEGYNDTERDYFLENGLESFTHIKPFTVLKNYINLIFEPKSKNVFSRLLFEGFFEDKVYQNNLSETFYSCVRSASKIEQFEAGLTEKAGSSLLTVHNELQKVERDKDMTEKLNNIITGINQRAATIIEEEANRFNQLLKYLTEIINDTKERNPAFINNIKVIGGNKNNEFIHDLFEGHGKMAQFIKIMRNFTVIL
ncbi:MAG: hypothetical protein JXB88_11900 [Spirochaetales bacterium]|nr:hypothetical protein [Spirochaetales bacterium]